MPSSSRRERSASLGRSAATAKEVARQAEGENPFAEAGWSRQVFPVIGTCLREGPNTLAIENLEKSDVLSGPPFLVLNYAVLRARE